MNDGHLVTQSNNLIEARHKQPLNAREQKIILTMVSMIQPSDEDFSTYDISIRDFHELLGLEGREKYTELKNIVGNLMSKVIEIPEENGSWVLTHWVSVAKYVSGEGVIRLKFAPELKEYLLQLKRAFTSYRLSNILSLRSAYAIRLYELMKKWQHLGKWEIPVESLRGKLGATTKTYNLYGNFKNRVIKPSVKELNEKTDVQIDFKEIKKGRKVVKIEFAIKHHRDKEIRLTKPKKDELDKDLFNKLSELAKGFELSLSGFKELDKIAKEIYTEDEYIQQLELLVKLVNYKSEKGASDNPIGLMIHILRGQKELLEQGLDPRLSETVGKAVRSEVLPDWFTNGTKPQNQSTHEEIAKDKAELEKLLRG